MVSIGISEFTFGFAFLHELTIANWKKIKAFPVLPSLQKEKDEGWDAKLPVKGLPYFYQFKLAEYLFADNAKFIDDGTYSTAYFRIGLHRRENNRQHRLLWKLGQTNSQTFYVAPEVKDQTKFNDAFLKKTVFKNSRKIRLSSCKNLATTDGKQHYITFRPNDPVALFHSEAQRIARTYRGREILSTYEEAIGQWRTLDTVFAKELLDRTIETVRSIEGIEKEPTIRSQRQVMDGAVAGLPRTAILQRVADITATVFGATMVMVGEPPKA